MAKFSSKELSAKSGLRILQFLSFSRVIKMSLFKTMIDELDDVIFILEPLIQNDDRIERSIEKLRDIRKKLKELRKIELIVQKIPD